MTKLHDEPECFCNECQNENTDAKALYYVSGKVGRTAEYLAQELDLSVDRVHIALQKLIDKGLITKVIL